MNKNEFEKMLDAMAESWTNRKYEMVAAHFAEQLFYSDSINYTFYNKTDLLNFFKNDGGYEQLCLFHNAVFDEKKQEGAAEYTYKGTFCYHGTVWIKIQDEKIVVWREYQQITVKSWDDFWGKSK
ncbi:MAG: hypothetical protein LUM44_16890 [Pyrinomonadaceae bacterium]|nr:hypothetical protein [Pyrinomonadaceae bacterium]